MSTFDDSNKYKITLNTILHPPRNHASPTLTILIVAAITTSNCHYRTTNPIYISTQPTANIFLHHRAHNLPQSSFLLPQLSNFVPPFSRNSIFEVNIYRHYFYKFDVDPKSDARIEINNVV